MQCHQVGRPGAPGAGTRARPKECLAVKHLALYEPTSAPIERWSFPFSAIVGQERMKLALTLNAINPAIGGVLITGERGTAKSTAVRALARLLPEQVVVDSCRYG